MLESNRRRRVNRRKAAWCDQEKESKKLGQPWGIESVEEESELGKKKGKKEEGWCWRCLTSEDEEVRCETKSKLSIEEDVCRRRGLTTKRSDV